MRRIALAPSRGALAVAVIRPVPVRLRSRVWSALPWFGLPREVNLWRLRNLPNVARGLWRVAFAQFVGVPHFYGVLYLRKTLPNGRVLDYGLASFRVVTDAGVNFLRDNLDTSSSNIANMKYHGFGTGTTGEATSDTALVTELTTQYATDNTRPTGSQAANGTGDYQTVATLAPDSGGTLAITEHGIFSQAANSGGTLLDRSKFAAVNLLSGADSLQATYDFVMSSGG